MLKKYYSGRVTGWLNKGVDILGEGRADYIFAQLGTNVAGIYFNVCSGTIVPYEHVVISPCVQGVEPH